MKHTTTLGILALLALSTSLALAQRPGGQGGPGGGMRGGPGGMRGGMMMGMREYDTNGNILVEENEIIDGMARMQARMAKLKTFMVEEFDADKDGALSEEEGRSAMGFFRSLGMVARFDADKNWTLSDEEVVDACEQLGEDAQRYNERVLERVDTNQDGKVSEAEAEAARKEMEERMAQFRERMSRRGEDNEEDRGGRRRR